MVRTGYLQQPAREPRRRLAAASNGRAGYAETMLRRRARIRGRCRDPLPARCEPLKAAGAAARRTVGLVPMSNLLRGNRSHRLRTMQRLNSLRYRPAWRQLNVASTVTNAEQTVQRPPEFMFRIRGVLRKQGNYVVVNIKFCRRLQEGEDFLPGQIRGRVQNDGNVGDPPIVREGFQLALQLTLIRSSNSVCVSRQKLAVLR